MNTNGLAESLTLPDKQMAELALQGLPVNVEYLTTEVKGHAAIRPANDSGVALSNLVPSLILRVSPSDSVLHLREKGVGH